MKKHKRILTLLLVSILFVFTACNKDKNAEKNEFYNEIEYQQEDLKFDGDGDYEKVVVNPIVKLEGCKFIVAGTILTYFFFYFCKITKNTPRIIIKTCKNDFCMG